MNIDEAKQYLDSFINFEKNLNAVASHDFKLTRVSHLLTLLDNPQQKLKIIHIAGTKGKGSVSVMTAQILKKGGYKVGLYTSPHIHRYNERIRILSTIEGKNSEDIFDDAITDIELTEVINNIQPVVDQMKNQFGRLTFYELYTAVAFYYFAQQKCDAVVLETGLGGRLDATNATDSLVCAITPIGLEHTHILGNTLGEIAFEKSGIIKNKKQSVVIAPQTSEAMKVIENKCSQLGISPICVTEADYPEFEISLLGRHQKMNAAVSIRIVHSLNNVGFCISDEVVREGLQSTVWPIRFEIVSKNPVIILDAAHTKESVASFVETYKDVFSGKQLTCIFGASNDKDIASMLCELNKVTGCVILTKANHPRSADLDVNTVKKYLTNAQCIFRETAKKALVTAQETTLPDQCIAVVGSVFLASEIRGLLCTKLKI